MNLNFLPLNKQEFEFDVWARLYIKNEKKWDQNIKKFKLPSETGTYQIYWISLINFENANQKKLKSHNNIHTTIFYLFETLKQKLQNSNIQFIQKENEKKFTPYHLYILLEKNQYGWKSIRIEPYYLKFKNLFGFLVDYKFLQNPEIQINKEIQKLSFILDDDYKSNVNYHIDKYIFIAKFLEKNLDSFKKIGEDLEILNKFEKLEYELLKFKKHIFTNIIEDSLQFLEINKNEIYRLEEKDDKDIKYIYIFYKDHKYYVNYLINALNGEIFNTFKGLEKLELPKQTKENIKGISIDSFNVNLEDILNNNIQSENSILIAVLPKKESEFYFKLKNICLKKDIPLQVVLLETIYDKSKFKRCIVGIALQILVKLNGASCITKTENTNYLIIGVNHFIERNTNNNSIKFYSYAVLLESSGKFLSIQSLANSDNKNEFLQKISEKIDEIIRQYNYKKIVFHFTEKINKKIIAKIKNTIQKIKDIEFYMIIMNNNSKFFGYSLNNSLIPYDGSIIRLSEKEFLLWTEGLNPQNPTARKRYNNPIYIDFYYSNQNNINYYSFLQDIFALSGIHYRGFIPSSLPVSIFCLKSILNFYKNFKKYNLEIPFEERKRMWFL